MMNTINARIEITIGLMLLTFAPALSGKDYHVAPTGSDSAVGTRARPFRTIQKAADVMGPGDTCIIRGGTYR